MTPGDIMATNTPSDTQVPSYDAASNLFKWIAAGGGGGGGGSSSFSDGAYNVWILIDPNTDFEVGTLTFELTSTCACLIVSSARMYTDLPGYYVFFWLEIDGTIYDQTLTEWSGETTILSRALDLSAGSHTVRIMARRNWDADNTAYIYHWRINALCAPK